MYKYETHLHTSPVSRCAVAGVEESLTYYKELDYDGVFITNHFINGNIDVDADQSYEEKIEFYFSDYEKAVRFGAELGIKVFAGVEFSYRGTDFLAYGLEKKWFLEHPEIMTMEIRQQLTFLMESGALVIQAHPFREAAYIDHIRLFPRNVHGVEIINSCRKDEENEMAKIYAQRYGLTPFAGSDNHRGPKQKNLAGVCCTEPICSVEEFAEKVKNREMEIFTQVIA